jgi:hypothetical protein
VKFFSTGGIVKVSSFLGLLLAWLLWSQQQIDMGVNWIPKGGFENRSQCIEALNKKLEMWRTDKDAKVGANSVMWKGKDYVVTYHCLPENVDPPTREKD